GRNGPIPRPTDVAWPWGDAAAVLDAFAPDARVVNLETSVTRSDEFAPGKAVHYRMSPANLPCLAEIRPDACVLANNHVLDFGRRGLLETLEALTGAGLRAVGAGRDAPGAWSPAAVPLPGGDRLLVLSFATPSSGVPGSWAAGERRAGVAVVGELSDATADAVVDLLRRHRRAGDVAVVSVHWGSNWGYSVPREQVRFAHRLVDGGVDLVHGHSSHHPRAIEVYRGRLVLYGCGDFVDDYEGITGHEEYRDDLRVAYLASLAADGALAGLRLAPLRAARMRLERAAHDDAAWLSATLDRISRRFGSRVEPGPDGLLTLRW
ncbi:MAG TPA: CapA family protein, partial [Pseudonocardia sp.]|nr:CapA family protein [Pseudonocardia sp.]